MRSKAPKPISPTCQWSIFVNDVVLRCKYPCAAKSAFSSDGFCIFHRIEAEGARAQEHAIESHTSTPEQYVEKAKVYTYGVQPPPKPVKAGDLGGALQAFNKALAKRRGG